MEAASLRWIQRGLALDRFINFYVNFFNLALVYPVLPQSIHPLGRLRTSFCLTVIPRGPMRNAFERQIH